MIKGASFFTPGAPSTSFPSFYLPPPSLGTLGESGGDRDCGLSQWALLLLGHRPTLEKTSQGCSLPFQNLPQTGRNSCPRATGGQSSPPGACAGSLAVQMHLSASATRCLCCQLRSVGVPLPREVGRGPGFSSAQQPSWSTLAWPGWGPGSPESEPWFCC